MWECYDVKYAELSHSNFYELGQHTECVFCQSSLTIGLGC